MPTKSRMYKPAFIVGLVQKTETPALTHTPLTRQMGLFASSLRILVETPKPEALQIRKLNHGLAACRRFVKMLFLAGSPARSRRALQPTAWLAFYTKAVLESHA